MKLLGRMMGTQSPLRPKLLADRLGFDLRLPVGPDAVESVRFQERMVVGNSVDRGRGDVDESVDAVGHRGLQEKPRAVDPGRQYVARRIERERHRAVDHRPHARHRGVDRRAVADVPHDRLDPPLRVRVVERGQVDRADAVVARQEVSNQVDAGETGAARDQHQPGVASSQWSPFALSGLDHAVRVMRAGPRRRCPGPCRRAPRD